jgi:plastocyanin
MDGLGRSTIEGVVRRQIANVRRGSIMPKDLVKGDDARDVAAYVALVAGVPGKDTGELASVGGAPGATKTTTAKGGILTIPADPSGALAFQFGKATAKPGKLEIVMPNPAPIQHDIGIKGDGQGPVVGKGGSSKFSVTLKPGSYEYFCSVPGHEAGGMKGTLIVK